MDNQPAPRSAGEVRQLVQRYATHNGYAHPSKTQRGACMKYLCEAWPDSNLRHQCYGWLFHLEYCPYESMTSKELSDPEIDALRHWIDAQPIGEVWFAGPRFYKEAGFVAAEAVKDFGEQAGQGDLFATAADLGGVVTEIARDEPTVNKAWDLDDL